MNSENHVFGCIPVTAVLGSLAMNVKIIIISIDGLVLKMKEIAH